MATPILEKEEFGREPGEDADREVQSEKVFMGDTLTGSKETVDSNYRRFLLSV